MIVRSMISLVLAAMFLLTPAGADLFDDMNAKVSEYNDKVDQIPGTLKGILSDQDVIIVVYMNEAGPASGSGFGNESIELAGPAFALELSEGPFVTESGATMNMIATTDSDASVIRFGRWSDLDEEHNWDGEEFAETIVVTTNEDTARAILDSGSPGDTFMDAYDSGLITIEASERARLTTKISLAIMPWMMKLYMMIS
ncbi:MAG: hypothetical protein JW705_02110 [Methanosarcinaceae archaeon]|nr:hypothetical protein [Methanosarcinaceae archaeon]